MHLLNCWSSWDTWRCNFLECTTILEVLPTDIILLYCRACVWQGSYLGWSYRGSEWVLCSSWYVVAMYLSSAVLVWEELIQADIQVLSNMAFLQEFKSCGSSLLIIHTQSQVWKYLGRMFRKYGLTLILKLRCLMHTSVQKIDMLWFLFVMILTSSVLILMQRTIISKWTIIFVMIHLSRYVQTKRDLIWLLMI